MTKDSDVADDAGNYTVRCSCDWSYVPNPDLDFGKLVWQSHADEATGNEKAAFKASGQSAAGCDDVPD